MEKKRPPIEPMPDPEASMAAHMVRLVVARHKNDFLMAADAHRKLEKLGVSVKFRRHLKGGAA